MNNIKNSKVITKIFLLLLIANFVTAVSAMQINLTQAVLVDAPHFLGGEKLFGGITGGAGDFISTSFTNEGNNIVNEDGSIPRFQAIVATGNDGIIFQYNSEINFLEVTDFSTQRITLNTTTGIARSASLQAAAFDGTGGIQDTSLVDFFLNNNLIGDNLLTIPDFNAIVGDIYYGVDLTHWNNSGFIIDELLFGTTFDITDGISALLPGITFSRSQLVYTNNGWQAADTLSTVVVLDGFHSSGVVPEPATLALLALGLAGIGFGRRKKVEKPR